MASINVGLFTRVASVFVRAVPSTKVSGVWTEAIRMYTRVSGVWKVVWANAANALGGTTRTIGAIEIGEAKAGWQTSSNGSISIKQHGPGPDSFVGSGNWLTYELGRSYEVKFSIVSGVFNSNPTLDTWLAAAATRTFTKNSSGGFKTATMEVQWREVGGSTLRTINVTLTAEGGGL